MNQSITQALIFAGGFGTRMSKEKNPLQSKPLMEHNGKAMIEYVVDTLIEVGVKDIVIATRPHSHDRIQELLKTKDASIKCVMVSEDSIRENIPELFSSYLKERFFVLHGHHPVTPEHLKKMLDGAKSHTAVITGYSDVMAPSAKEVLLKYTSNEQPSNTGETYLYLRNPYILTTEIACALYLAMVNKTLGYQMFSNVPSNEIAIVAAEDMPPEFNTDEEYQVMVRFLNSRNLN